MGFLLRVFISDFDSMFSISFPAASFWALYCLVFFSLQSRKSVDWRFVVSVGLQFQALLFAPQSLIDSWMLYFIAGFFGYEKRWPLLDVSSRQTSPANVLGSSKNVVLSLSWALRAAGLRREP